MVRIREYYQDPNTPTAHDVLPAAFAAVRNSAGELLLVRRIDDGNWELPGGRIEVGESASHTVAREVAEESGITIELTALAGVYSDPTHVLVDPNDTIHQQLALCFHAVPHATQRRRPAPPRPAPPRRHRNQRCSLVQHHRDRRPQDAPGDATTNRQRPPRAGAILLRVDNLRISGRYDNCDSLKKRDRSRRDKTTQDGARTRAGRRCCH
jgi:ADP-ribose pyrophosphatase YjhB (NUDIX family)